MKYTVLLNDVGDVICIISFYTNLDLIEKLSDIMNNHFASEGCNFDFFAPDDIENSNFIVYVNNERHEYSLTKTDVE